jgi:hypothetical protein
MDKLEELYQIAYDEKLPIIKYDIRKSNALYFNIDNNCLIALDYELKDNILKKCILAEELGHHFMGVMPTCICNNDYCYILQRSRNEYKALKWAGYKLIPPEVLKLYIGRSAFLYEVAEELCVSEEFLERVYELYKQKGEII